MLLKIYALWLVNLILWSAVVPHPLPDGHVYRDIQVVVDGEKVSVDVRLSASDKTWIDLITKMDAELRAAKSDSESENPNSDPANSDSANSGGSEPEAIRLLSHEGSAIEVIRSKVISDDYLPLPTTDDEVSAWLTQDKNRRIIEWWVAKQVAAKLGQQSLALKPVATSRQNGRHHWAISVEFDFQLPDDPSTDKLAVVVSTFKAFPGLVRRAIKTRGDAFVEETDLPPVIVRAEFENIDDESTPEQRTEYLEAKIRF